VQLAAELDAARLRAVAGQAARAGGARAARRRSHDDALAGPHLLHGRADALDRAGALVAENARERDAEIIVAPVHVGLAHAAGGDADDQLIGPGIGELERFEPERRAFLR